MKTSRFFTAIGLITAVWFSACTNDEPMDDNALPEGKYPLEIASVTMSVESSSEPWNAKTPQTRVTENADGMSSVWEWDGTERIGVQLYADDDDDVATYTLNADNTLTPDKTLYWKNKEQTTVMAWYPVETEVSLANQKDKLAYVLKGSGIGTYQDEVTLSFTHQLAKVRVELTGTADIRDWTIQMKGYTTCINNQGIVTGSDEGWITMFPTAYNDGTVCYEANAVPGFILDKAAFQIIQSNGTPIAIDLNAPVSLTSEEVHTITLTVNKNGTTTANLSEQGAVYTVQENTSVIIDGGGQSLNKRIIIQQGASVMLKNVILSVPTDGNNTIEVQGDATLSLSGYNEVNGNQDNCPLAVSGGTLTINGTSKDQLKLIGNGTYGGCLGLKNETNLIINGGHIIADGSQTGGAGIGSYFDGGNSCGFITINGGKIEATGGEASAGIGAADQGDCGEITIIGGCIIAKGGGGWGGAGIGSSSSGSCGNITISGKNTSVTATAGNNSSDDIGVGNGGSCGTVTITDATVIATNGRIHEH